MLDKPIKTDDDDQRLFCDAWTGQYRRDLSCWRPLVEGGSIEADFKRKTIRQPEPTVILDVHDAFTIDSLPRPICE